MLRLIASQGKPRPSFGPPPLEAARSVPVTSAHKPRHVPCIPSGGVSHPGNQELNRNKRKQFCWISSCDSCYPGLKDKPTWLWINP